MRRALTQNLDDGSVQWWVSNPDDDSEWLPVNMKVDASMVQDVREAFNPTGRGTKPLRFAHRCLTPVFRNKIITEEICEEADRA